MKLQRMPGVLGRVACGLTVLVGASMLAVRAPAQQEQNGAEPATAMKPGELNVEASRVYVHVDKTGFGHEHAVMGRLSGGELHLGAAQKAGLLTFDMPSFAADPAEARKYVGLVGATDAGTQRQVTDNMLGGAVLDVVKFPTATYEIDSCKLLPAAKEGAPPQYQLDGKFTLHGVTKPLRLTAQVEETNGWHHVRGKFAMLQTQFGITPFSKALGAVGVADQVTVWGDLWVHP